MQGWVDLVGLVTYRGGIPARRRSPISVLTGPNVEQLRSCDKRRYRYAALARNAQKVTRDISPTISGSLLVTSAEEGGYVFGAVCLSVCPSYYSQTCERILTKFFVGVGHGSRTKWYNFGGDADHASDPGVESLKSGSSRSAEVCALWAYLVTFCIT